MKESEINSLRNEALHDQSKAKCKCGMTIWPEVQCLNFTQPHPNDLPDHCGALVEITASGMHRYCGHKRECHAEKIDEIQRPAKVYPGAMDDCDAVNQLLPCPFCGGPVKLEKTIDRRKWWGVVCRNTGNLGGSCALSINPSASKHAAIARWNMRSESATISELKESNELLAKKVAELENPWISVSERLPDTQKMVLIHNPFSQRGSVDYGYLDHSTRKFKVQCSLGWDDAENYNGAVTHWMPIPQPPKGESQ